MGNYRIAAVDRARESDPTLFFRWAAMLSRAFTQRHLAAPFLKKKISKADAASPS